MLFGACEYYARGDADQIFRIRVVQDGFSVGDTVLQFVWRDDDRRLRNDFGDRVLLQASVERRLDVG